MLGLGTSLIQGGSALLTYIKDGLKLYMPYNKDAVNKGTQFVGEGSCSFDGSNDYVDIGSDINLGTSSTISLWVGGLSSTSATRYLFGSETANHFELRQQGAAKQLTVIMGASGDTDLYTYTFDNSDWVHLAFVRISTIAWKLYLNGALIDTLTHANWSNDDTKIRYMGRNSAGYYLQAKMKNVALWSRALTATEVQNVMYKSYAEVSGRLASGLVSWWTLEKTLTSTTTKDVHGSNDGTLGDGITAGTMPTFTSNIYGGAVPVIPRAIDNAPTVQADAIGSGSAYFDNTYTDYITGDDTGFPATSSARTVTFWMNADSVTTYGNMFAYGTASSSNGFAITWDDSSANIMVGKYGGNADSASSTTISLNTWHHIAVTHDGSSTITYYLNGVADGTATLASLNTTLNAFLIGDHLSGWGGANAFDGNICQVGLWSAVLTQEQIQSIMEKTYEEFTASEKTNLVSYWALDEADGNGVVDKVDETLGSAFYEDSMATNDNLGDWSGNDCNITFDTDHFVATETSATQNSALLNNLGALVTGNVYKISIDIKSGTFSGSISLGIHSTWGSVANEITVSPNSSSFTTFTFYSMIVSGDDTFNIFTSMGSGETYFFKNLSIKPVNGHTGILI